MRWVDVFLTQGNEVKLDVHLMPVRSIKWLGDTNHAIVAEHATTWLMCAFHDMSINNSELDSIEVGDLIRVGDAGSGGYTDYLTVMELRHATHLLSPTAIRTTPDAAAQDGTVTLILMTLTKLTHPSQTACAFE